MYTIVHAMQQNTNTQFLPLTKIKHAKRNQTNCPVSVVRETVDNNTIGKQWLQVTRSKHGNITILALRGSRCTSTATRWSQNNLPGLQRKVSRQTAEHSPFESSPPEGLRHEMRYRHVHEAPSFRLCRLQATTRSQRAFTIVERPIVYRG